MSAGPPQPPGAEPGQPPGSYGYPPPYGYPYPPARQTEGYAIAAFVCAVAAFFVCPIIPAVVALALAPTAERNIAASRGWKEGEGLVKAARIIAWVNIALAVVGVLFFLVAAAAISSSR